MTDPLDWQILDDKAPEEPDPLPVVLAQRHPRDARVWWVGGALAVAAAGALAVRAILPTDTDTQLNTTVLALLATEPRLSPVGYAVSDLGPLRVESLEDSGDGRVHATLAYTATDVDGAALHFGLERNLILDGTLLNFDRPAGDTDPLTLTGFAHLELEVLPQDRAFVEDLIAPYLRDVARQACELWSCPPTATARLAFTLKTTSAADQALTPLLDSWLLATVAGSVSPASVELPSPAQTGRPIDNLTLDAYRRRLAARMLTALAHDVAFPAGSAQPTNGDMLVVGALAARTAALLGLEPVTVAGALPAGDDAGVIGDAPEAGPAPAERVLRRLNAFLGAPGSELERALWQRLQSGSQTTARALIDLAREDQRTPEDVLGLYFGAGITRDILDQLTRTDWTAQVSCVGSVHVAGPQGDSAVRWQTEAERRILELGPVSDDGAFQALVFAGYPLLRDNANGRLMWMVWPRSGQGAAPRFAWDTDQTLAFNDAWRSGVLGLWAAQTVDGAAAVSAVRAIAAQQNAVEYRWRGYVYTDAPQASDEANGRVFRDHRLFDGAGELVADWGLAAWPNVNPRTGEIAVLSRADAPDGAPEYRLTVYENPADPIGRVVWRSGEFGWRADMQPAWAAVRWAPETHALIGALRPVTDGFVAPLPVFWRTDPDSAQSVELPAPRLASATIFDYSVSADGRYIALVSASSQGPGTQVGIVSAADGELVNGFDLPGGLLQWATSGHAFTFPGAQSPEEYARPEDHAPVLARGADGCANPVWSSGGMITRDQ